MGSGPHWPPCESCGVCCDLDFALEKIMPEERLSSRKACIP